MYFFYVTTDKRRNVVKQLFSLVTAKSLKQTKAGSGLPQRHSTRLALILRSAQRGHIFLEVAIKIRFRKQLSQDTFLDFYHIQEQKL